MSELCVLDGRGAVARRERVATTRAAVRTAFGAMPSALVALEVGTHSPWMSRELAELGHEVIVAHPAKVPLIYQNVRKRDRNDAEALARLARLDRALLSPVVHRSAQAQQDLQLLRSRDALVRTGTQLVNHVRSAVKVSGERLPTCSAQAFAKKVDEHIPPELHAALAPLLETIAALIRTIRAYDKQSDHLARERYPETEVLRHVPGVGPITSLAFVLTLESPTCFTKSRDLGPYLGLTPKQRQSGDSEPHLRISKAGNGYLRRLLVGRAQYILGPFAPDTALRRWARAKNRTRRQEHQKTHHRRPRPKTRHPPTPPLDHRRGLPPLPRPPREPAAQTPTTRKHRRTSRDPVRIRKTKDKTFLEDKNKTHPKEHKTIHETPDATTA